MIPPWAEQPIHLPQHTSAISRPCDYCKVEIREGDECIEVFDGVLGKSPKSGQGIVVEGVPGSNETTIVHRECLLQTLIESDPEIDPFRFCSACGVDISDPDDD
jgi:hypothetical protein